MLAVTGDRSRARAWARTLMLQLAAWRAPHDLRVLTAFDGAEQRAVGVGQVAAAPAGRPGAPAGGVLLARARAELEALLEPELRPRLEQLRRLAEADVRGRDVPLVAPELVVIVDGYRPTIRSTRSRRSASC